MEKIQITSDIIEENKTYSKIMIIFYSLNIFMI